MTSSPSSSVVRARRVRRLRAVVEATDVERVERTLRSALPHELVEDHTDRGPQLKAMARETEGVDEIRRRAAEPDHGKVVRHLPFDAGPAADHERRGERRYDAQRLGHRARRDRRERARALLIEVDPRVAAAEHDVAARYLAKIDVAAAYADGPREDGRQRLGDEHVGRDGGDGNGLSERRGDRAAPGAGRIDQEGRRDL